MNTLPVISMEFTGREQQLERIRRPIAKEGTRYLISIQGRGGVGKTYVLREIYQEYAGQDQVLCFPIVDFSQSKTRTQRWLMDFIAEHAADRFAEYHRIVEAIGKAGRAAPAPSQTELENAFFDDFLRCEQQVRCLFLFDTLELIQDTLIIDFLLDMATKAQNSVFVLAGRRNNEMEARFKSFGASSVVSLSLSGFEKEDALKYIQRHPSGMDLSPDEQQALYLLAEEGVPIKLALALDWLSRGFVMHTLAAYSLQQLQTYKETNPAAFQAIITEFEHELVAQIGQLGTDVDQAIYIMAHVYRRFNRELLQLLLPKADTNALAEQISSLPFVKTIEADYFVLHDEIQRMVVRHVWDWSDPSHEKRRELSERVMLYYDTKIEALRAGPAESAAWEYSIYEIERLHYQLDIDLVEGYRQFIQIFEELEDRREFRDIELAALALDFLLKDRPLPPRLRTFATTYYYGWILVRRNYLAQARSHIQRGLEQLMAERPGQDATPQRRAFMEREVEQRLGEIHTLYGYCHRLLGDWTTAIDLYDRGRRLNERLIDQLQAEATADREAIKRSVRRLAETLNDIANLQRMQGNLEAARRYCKASLLIRKSLGERRTVGHCCYVMATIMWELGNTSEAMNYLQQARAHYRATGTERLERARIDCYEGFVMFRTGNTHEALRLLGQALDTTSITPGFQDEHAETLTYLSRIYREQKTEKSLELALKTAEEALRIAQKIPNDYWATESRWIICQVLADMLREEPHDDALRSQFEEQFAVGLALAQRQNYRRLEGAFREIKADQEFERKDFLSAFRGYSWVCRRAMEFKPAVFARALGKLAERLYQLAREDSKQAVSICERLHDQWEKEDQDSNAREVLDEVEYVKRIAQDTIQRQRLELDFENAYHTGNWKDALRACGEVDTIAIHLHPDRATSLYHRAEVYHGVNNFSLARLYCERAIRIWKAYDTHTAALGDGYLLGSRINWKLGATKEAAEYLKLAEEHYRKVDSAVGSGLIEYERAYIYFRTHQFDRTSESLARAIEIFQKTNEPIHLASTLNLKSRFARINREQTSEYEEINYKEAQQHGTQALQVLGDRDRFVVAEINLTLCILYYNWGRMLLSQGRTEAAKEHFATSREYNYQGWDKIEQINSPMLYSVYRGMQANLFLQEGEVDRARRHFLSELTYATQTKHMRLVHALDLLEDWIVSEPSSAAQEHSQWLFTMWHKEGLAEKYPQLEEALQWLMDHYRYILRDVTPEPQGAEIERSRTGEALHH